MKKIKSINNDSEFKMLGTCPYGGISKEELLARLIDKNLTTDDTIPIIKDNSFVTHPVQNELMLVATNMQLLNIKYSSGERLSYRMIVDNALGSIVELDGIKYIVSECPYEIAIHATLNLEKLDEDALILKNKFVTKESIKIDNTNFGLYLYKSRGNRVVGNTTDITKLAWYINDDHQTWGGGDVFIFCLKQK